MDRAAELAAALRQLAIDEDDRDLADTLLEAVAKVERFADYKLRNQTQGVLGETHVTLQDRIDSLFNVARDTHQLVFSVQQEQQTQGAALGAARAEFREGLLAIGERVTTNEAEIAQLKGWSSGVDAELASFRKSRDVSIAERAQHAHDLTESKAHRQRIQSQLDQLTQAVERIERQLGGSPSEVSDDATD